MANLSVSGNATSGNLLTAGLISATGNLYGNTIITTGTGGGISGTGNITGGNILTAGIVSATGNVYGGNLYIAGSGNILGNLNVQGNITFIDSNVIVTNDLYIELANNQSTYANINNAGLAVGPSGNALTYWQYNTSANAWTTNVAISATSNVIGGNITTAGLISATGNITGNYFIGDGSLLTGIAAGSSNTAITVIANAQSNITSVGTLTSLSVSGNTNSGNLLTTGILSVTGNITSNSYFVGNGYYLTGISSSGSSNIISNGNSSVAISSANANVIISVSGVGNVITVTPAGIQFKDTTVQTTAGIPNVAPGSSGNVLTSNGTSWVSSATVSSPIMQNPTNISSNITIAAGNNGFSVGPMTTDDGVTVIIAPGQRWIII